LSGEFPEAEEAFRQASRAGRKPDPGLAQLRLAQGQVDAAAAAIRRALEEAKETPARSRILPGYVEILLAAGDVAAARKGAEELAGIAASLDSPLLRGMAAEARGSVLLAEDDARGALTVLKEAAREFRDLDVPYEAARVHLLVGLACRRLGDEDTAKLELEAARETFARLGAEPDRLRVEELSRMSTVMTTAPIFPRRQVALGPGSRLGPYEILSSAGAGGMGQVFRARDTRLGRDVAVKILTAAHAGDPDSVRRFEKEARAVASLSHPNVVPLFDVGEQDGIRFAVSEFVAGETLRERMKREPVPPAEALEIAAQIADGLSAAHENGFVHRDIKPENVVLARPSFPRILDFGLAKRSAAMLGASASEEDVTQSAFLTEPGIITGTIGYMSPEQVRGETVDGRSDIFSLGVVLWEMLTGRRPFRGDSPVETLSAILREEPPPDPAFVGLPPTFERILRRSLEKRPEDRYQSAADLARDLRSLASDAIAQVGRRPRLATAIRTWLRPSGRSGNSS
jgi:tetratricopeptide (TPR) repeat protein